MRFFVRDFINNKLKNKPYVAKCRFLFLKFYKSESVCAEGESGNISFDLVKIMLLVGNGDGCAIFCSDRADVNGNLFIFVIYDIIRKNLRNESDWFEFFHKH